LIVPDPAVAGRVAPNEIAATAAIEAIALMFMMFELVSLSVKGLNLIN
jgi:hypothetical protein